MTKKTLTLLVCLSLVASSQAAIVTFDLSPAGTDNAIGLSPLNESPAVTNSTGSGNEIGSGISFNTDTLQLTFSLGYGSAFGFTDLTGPASSAHIHGPAPTNVPASVVIDLAPFHVLATNPAAGGSIVGSIVLTNLQADELLAGLYYINIHTPSNAPGEIRGQLIPVNTLPNLVCPPSTNAECSGDGTAFVSLSAQVSDDDGDALEVVWSVGGSPIQTNLVPAGTTNLTAVTFEATFDVGAHAIGLSVSDGFDSPVTCGTTVTVVDTLPPVITEASASPNVLWPPNHKMVSVSLTAVATDICGTNTVRIKSITSNQGVFAKGSGKTSPDWLITGDLSAQLRAERSGRDKGGRTYTIVLEAIDASGNTSTTNVVVKVPHNQRKSPHVLPPQAQAGNPPKANNGQNGNNGNQGNNSNGKNPKKK